MEKEKSTETTSKKQPAESSTELSGLTDYHWQRTKAAQKEVEEMLKHPYSYEEAKAQVARMYARRAENSKQD